MSVKIFSGLGAGFGLVLLAAGCASDPQIRDGITINDPYEAENRRTHQFNKDVDRNVISPVSNLVGGDDDGAPSDGPGAMDLVINAGSNLSLPNKVVNHVLQGRPLAAAQNTARFLVNSTIGIAGLFDPAGSQMGLTEVDTDFGATLARWGVPEGAYLELPVLGPSTQRDASGKVLDLVADPLSYVLTPAGWAGAYALRAGAKVGDRARFGDTVDSVLRDSADSYAQSRLIYLMHRRHDVGEEGTDFDPYEDSAAGDGIIDPYAE
ncbi:MlaA family lipoprotein [Paracoccus homiensis]|uniref:MlaA family lipoprotein n=1 Tax=Paracoccus homiensis TaxID=364199 RepID=UPI00398C9A01